MSGSAVGKIKASRVNNLNAATYIGPEGQMWYDVDTGILRLGDGVTPGGVIVGGGGSSASGPNGAIQFNNAGNLQGLSNLVYNSANNVLIFNGNIETGAIFTDQYYFANGAPFNPGSNIDLGNITQNVIPDGNNVYSLGSPAHQWKDLWVSNATIYLNGIPLSANTVTVANVTTPQLIFNGAPIVTSGPNAAPVTTNISTTANVAGNTIISNAVSTVSVTANILNSTSVTSNVVTTTSVTSNVVTTTSVTSNIVNSTSVVSNVVNTTTIQTSTLSAGGNIVGNVIIGNLFQYANGQSIVNDYSNANVANYLPVFTGNLNAGNAVITGNLQVQGTTTTVNITDIDVANLVITVGSNDTTPSVLSGGGLAVGNNLSGNESVATWFYEYTTNSWQSNIDITPTSNAALNLGNVDNYWNEVYATTGNFTGNITGGNISVSGNIQVNNISTVNDVSVSGNVYGYNVIAEGGNIYGNVIGNISGNIVAPGSNTQILFNAEGNVGASTALTFDSVANLLTIEGNVQAGNFITQGSTGNITGANYVQANNFIALGNISAGNFITSGSTGNITGANVIQANTIIATANISGNYILGNGAFLSGVITSVANINAGNSNIVVSPSANITVGVSGVSDVVVWAPTGEYVNGTVTANAFIGDGGNLSNISYVGNVHSNITLAYNYISVSTNNNQGIVTISDAGLTSQGVLSAVGGLSGNNLFVNTNINGGGNISMSGNIISDGNISGTFIGDGGGLSNISGAVTVSGNDQPNITSVGTLTALTIQSNIANYTGYVLDVANNAHIAGNLQVDGNINLTGNITQLSGNSGQFYGNLTTGFNALYAGLATGYSVQPDTVIQAAANYNEFAQINFQNINAGNAASTDIVATADAGDNYNYYVDMGITSSTYNGLSGNALGTVLKPNDAFLFTIGANSGVARGGNLVIAAYSQARSVKIAAGGGSDSNVVATFSAGQLSTAGNVLVTGYLSTTGNITGNYIIGNGSQLTGVIATGIGTLTALTVTGNIVSGNVQANNFTYPNGISIINNYSNANVDAYLPAYSGNVNANNVVITGNLQVNGTTTSVNTSNLQVANLTIGVGTTTNVASAVNGAGITVGNTTSPNIAIASWLYNNSANAWQTPINITPLNNYGATLGTISKPWGNIYGQAISLLGGIQVSSVVATNISGTLLTNSQPYINTIGTLTSDVSITGNIRMSGFIITGGYIASGSSFMYPNGLHSGTSLSVSGNITANGTLTAGNISSSGFASITGNISGGNIASTGSISVGGGVTAAGAVVGGGNITGGNINTAGVVSAAGNVYGNNLITVGIISTQGNITGNYIVGNGAYLTGLPASYANANAAAYFASGTSSSNISITGDVLTSGNISAGGTIIGVGNLTIGNISTAGILSAAGNIRGNSISATGLVSANSLTVRSGDLSLTSGNIRAGGYISAQGDVIAGTFGGNMRAGGYISAQGNIITAGYFLGNFQGNVSGNIVVPGANTNILYNNDGNAGASNNFSFDYASNALGLSGTASISGNVQGGNILTAGIVSATGNITGSYILGNGALLTGIITTVSNVTNGTSNLNIPAADANINLTVSGVGNVATFSPTGLEVAGTISAAGSITIGNIINNGYSSVTGNIDGGNLLTSGLISATGNIDGGNLLTSGLIAATSTITSSANIIGANLLTSGYITATGNVFAGAVYSAGNISAVGNITGNYFIGNGSQLTGVTATGIGTIGNLSVTGTITTGNITATGNIKSANIITTGYISSANGLASTNAYPAPFIDGIVVDYVEGNGRISVGVADGIKIFNAGVGNVLLVNIDYRGNVSATGSFSTAANVNSGNVTVSGYGNIGDIVTNTVTASTVTNSKYFVPSGPNVVGTGSTLVWAAADSSVNGFKMTVRAQVDTGSSIQIAEILGAKDSGGNVSYTTYGRVNTNPSVSDFPITVGQDGGGNISVTINSGAASVTYTYEVTEFYAS